MSTRRPTAAQLRGARPEFIVAISWAGATHRFARVPLTIASDDGDLRYSGSLDLRGYSDTLGRAGQGAQAGSASMSVEFESISVAQAYIEARPLEGASVELALVFVRAGVVVTSYEDRLVQMAGTVSRPQFGFPGRSSGFVAFSAVSRATDARVPVLRPSWAVNASTHPNANYTSVDGLRGTPYVLPFGSPGDDEAPGAPAYLVRTSSGDRRIQVGVGRMHATHCRLWDEDGTEYGSAPISHDTDSLGQTYAYVLLTGAPGGFNNTGGKHWVSFHYLGADVGALRCPFRGGYLTRADDLLRYLYGRTATAVDHPAWVAAGGVLGRYTFSGYVNDPAVTVSEFVRGQLLPLLPLSLRIGADGIYPISLLPLAPLQQLQQVTLGPASGIEQVSPVQVTRQLQDVVNQVALSYQYNARDGRLVQSLVASTDPSMTSRTRYTEAIRSREVHGEREGSTIEASYVHETSSAHHLLRWLLYDRGFLHMSVQVSAAPWWGWLMVGDQISLTASDIALSGRRAVVASKAWVDGRWRFELAWSTAPIENNF